MRNARIKSLFAVMVVAAGCGGASSRKVASVPAAPSANAQPPASGSCAQASNAKPLGAGAASTPLALARIEGRRVALVADEDAKAVLTIDLETKALLAETSVGGVPGHLYVASDGRVLSTLRDRAELVVLTASRADAPLAKACSVSTPTEPLAMALTPDQSTLLVTSGWGRRLTAFDAQTLGQRFETKLPREPRSIVVADDGRTAFVSHAVGSQISAVDLSSAAHEVRPVSMRGFQPAMVRTPEQRRRVGLGAKGEGKPLDDVQARTLGARPSCQGFALAKSSAVPGRIFAPQVMVDPGDLENRPGGYGDENHETETPAVAVLDESTAETLLSSVLIGRELAMFKRGRDQRDPRPECLLPRAAAIDPASKSLLVTCFGIDAVVEYDATSATPATSERRRWTVGSGPSGLAIDAEKRRGVVWSQFDRTLSTFPIGGTELVDDKATPPLVVRSAMPPLREKLPAEYALGRILFHAAGDARISADGRACASCHPDGRDDAITWATPEGPRRSIMLAGRAVHTPPYSWNGNETSLHNHLGNTFDRLSGKGLRSIELDALIAYVSAMPAPPAAKEDGPKVERGKQIFASSEAGCANCHSGSDFTDSKNHDVGSRHKADRGASFNTPSLHLVGGTGPYFHDGRYATLGELLEKSDGKMGRTKHLSKADLESLEAYLRTL